jgi:conjugal transfer pilus assembly protein TraB
MFEKTKQDWADMPDAHKWAFGGFIAFGAMAIAAHAAFKPSKGADELANAVATQAAGQQTGAESPEFHGRTALPDSNRNQGLEDLTLKIDRTNARVEEMLNSMRAAPGTVPHPTQAPVVAQPGGQGSSTATPGNAGVVDLDALIPAPTFNNEGTGANGGLKQPGGGAFAGPAVESASAPERVQARMKVWDDDGQRSDSDIAALKREADAAFTVSIPANSALESVLLSGFNARPTGSTAGAVGNAQTSANNVGAPFVTRLKGDAILPNGWRLSDLGDCFLGGSAVAVLSAERAYAVADVLSCIKPNGEIYEGHVKAYALDVDGTLGIAGKVVSKQGSLLMQAALSGMASGLGAALSPTAIPTYNSSGTNGSTASYQMPNLGAVGATAAGQGVTQASAQLSKFYLQYASEVFPVVEVVSTTRATWVLEETVTLKRRDPLKEASR